MPRMLLLLAHSRRSAVFGLRDYRGHIAFYYHGLFVQLFKHHIDIDAENIRLVMAKDKQKEVKSESETETETKTVDETPQGVTVSTSVYKPLPRFRSGCPNC